MYLPAKTETVLFCLISNSIPTTTNTSHSASERHKCDNDYLIRCTNYTTSHTSFPRMYVTQNYLAVNGIMKKFFFSCSLEMEKV